MFCQFLQGRQLMSRPNLVSYNSSPFWNWKEGKLILTGFLSSVIHPSSLYYVWLSLIDYLVRYLGIPIKLFIYKYIIEDIQEISITKTCLHNFDPIKPHFYIVKLGFTGVYIIFLIVEAVLTSTTIYVLRNKKNIRFFYLEIFIFCVIKFSVYLNRHIFVMTITKRSLPEAPKEGEMKNK